MSYSAVLSASMLRATCAAVAVYTVPLSLLFVVLLALASILVASIPPRDLVITGVPIDGRPVPGASSGADDGQLLWFLHVSDIHLDQKHPERTAQLIRFCNETMRIVRPALVLATGDLTDGPDATLRQHTQIESEWLEYRETLESFDLFNRSVWLDLRGNHDVYGVPSLNSSANLYRQYGVYGTEHHYAVELLTAQGGYRFVSLDLAIDPGMRKPWAFFGAKQDDMAPILETIKNPTLSNGLAVNHTFLLGHFPMVTTASAIPWGDMAPYVTAYFCGHLHAYGMYRRMWAGYFELEVEDMKTNKGYRLFALDHDLLSFVDVHLDEWPLVLVTNPKNAQFLSQKEPVGLIAASTHVRALVFSPWDIDTVTVTIDQGSPISLARSAPGSPLFTAPWDASAYLSGLHTIVVTASDAAGNSRIVQQEFSVDGTSDGIPYSFPTMINGFPSSIFVDVVLSIVFTYYIGLLLWFPRMIFFFRTSRFLRAVSDYWDSNNPAPVLVNDSSMVEEFSPTNTTFEVFPVYKDLDNTSARGQFAVSWSSHMNTVARMPWLQGWGFIIFWSLVLAAGPVMIIEFMDGEHWGVAFSWGVMSPSGFSVAVESEIMGMLVCLLVFAPAALLLIEWNKDDRELKPLRCYTIFLAVLTSVGQIILLIEVLLFFPITTWLSSPFGLAFTCTFLVQGTVSLRSALRRHAQGPGYHIIL